MESKITLFNPSVEKDVKIVSPQSGREISVGKATYNKLFKEGYSENELLNNQNIETREFIRDQLYVIMINADYNTIQNLCITNKIANKVCNDQSF